VERYSHLFQFQALKGGQMAIRLKAYEDGRAEAQNQSKVIFTGFGEGNSQENGSITDAKELH